MTENNDDLLNIVNKSGFLFQTRIEKEIEATKPGNWTPIAHEHRWVDPLDGKEGYIDLILEYGIERMVIECKKVSEAKWIFLVPNDQVKTNRAKLLWTFEGLIKQDAYRKKISAWHNFQTKAASLEALFCIIRGQGENDTPMLERLSSYLLRSIENLVHEELEYEKRATQDLHIYYPVIVTNSTLLACQYEPNNIEISSGQLANAEFEEVPFIRFRKNLSSSVKTKEIRDIKQANLDYERTIFIINSNHVVDILKQINLPYDINAPWPWEGLK
ncbi:MAG: hypothetical protein FJZ86_15010 [Chloroflexi bacterium]|nr:hypothetical protein [Chloroflexota bacterium]